MSDDKGLKNWYKEQEALEEVKRHQEDADRNEKEIDEHMAGIRKLPD
jgi:hypothetical protein